MIWSTQSTLYSYLVFMIWKDSVNDRKGRVIIDIRELNKITLTNLYSLLLQSKIIILLLVYSYLSIIDAMRWFYQFLIARKDRHKFIVISHRGQEKSIVTLISYKSSSFYVQRQIDAILRSLKNFIKAFVDDIIVFSRILSKYLSYLRQIFELFRQRRVSLLSIKSFIDYSLIILLD